MPICSSERKQIVIVNFLYRHWFKAFTETGQSLNIYPDKIGRLAIELPDPVKILSIRYSPPMVLRIVFGNYIDADSNNVRVAIA